jgi:hypothetical protein
MWVRQIADKLAGKWFAKAAVIFIGGNALTEVAQRNQDNQEGHIWTPRINQHYIVFFNRLNGFLGRR